MPSKLATLTTLASATLAFAVTSTASAQLPGIDSEVHVSGFSSPLSFIQDPSNPSVQYVIQQAGLIRVVVDGVVQSTPFMNLAGVISSGGERGLLGLAFPPDYGTDGRFYVYYTASGNGATRIVRYERDTNNPLLGDSSSAEVLITVGQPFSNHNGGHLAFGSDGYLYAGLGDGGSGGDPGNRAQNPNTLLGKMIRIDVSPTTGYAIPADNPFVDDDPINALEEIWAFGVRNPWRYSFDNVNLGGTGAMVMADVGQNALEEINYEPAEAAGRNYGWKRFEGLNLFSSGTSLAYGTHAEPFHQYSHSFGRSITGGFIYRGTALGCEHRGRYFFADFITRRVWSVAVEFDNDGEAIFTGTRVEHTNDLGGSNAIGNISSFGEDADGELYLVSFNGQVRKIVPANPTTLTSVSAQFGTILAGGVDDLAHNDDETLNIRSQFGFLSSEPNVATLEVMGNTTADSVDQLDIAIRTRANNPGGTATIQMRNQDTGSLETVGTHPLNNTETLHLLCDIPNPGDYFANNGNCELRSKHVIIATFSLSGFISFYDQLQIVTAE